MSVRFLWICEEYLLELLNFSSKSMALEWGIVKNIYNALLVNTRGALHTAV